MNKKTLLLTFLIFCCGVEARESNLHIAGTLDFCDGLGKIAYGLVHQLGRDLSISYSKSHVCTFYYDPYKLRNHVVKVDDTEPTDIFLYTNPLVTLLSNDCYKHADPKAIKIAYSMFEADRIPEECVDCLNEQFDAIVIPDPFLFEVYRKSGIKKPIYCIPTGLYLEGLLRLSTKEREEGPFIFGCVSTDVYRKNLRKLVDAFIDRYGNNPDYQLSLQVKYAFTPDQETLEEYVESRNIENIEINSDTLSDEEYVDFLRSLDCYVILSTGEGFSNTPREAMAAGIPCIVSNNTGHTTICNSGYVQPVACPYKIDGWYEALSRNIGHQYDCSKSSVIEAMEEVADNYDYHFERAQEGRDWVARYLWPNLKKDFLTLFDPVAVVLADSNRLDHETGTLFTSDKGFYDKVNYLVNKRKCDLMLAASSGFCDGIGRIGYGIIDTLSEDIAIKSFRSKQHCDSYNCYIDFDDPYLVKDKIRATSHVGAPPVFLYIDSINGCLQDTCYKQIPENTVKFAYSMFESSAIPQKAVEMFNSYFDGIIVPDLYHIDVYKNSGVTIPIFCIPTGLYLERFLAEPAKTIHEKPFTFGCIATNSARKNVKKIVTVFHKLYGNNPDYLLKLHTKKPTMNDITLDMLEEGVGRLFEKVENCGGGSLADFFKNLPESEETSEEMVARLSLTNVSITSEIMTEREYIDYFKSIDCYLSLSLGEGFSNTPREAMALGIPTIVTNNTAQKTICESGFVVSIESQNEVEAKYSDFSEDLGKQYDCTEEAVETAMKNVVENYPIHLYRAAGGREWVKRYLWPKLKQDYLALLKPDKVILGSEDKIDSDSKSVTTKSMKFYEKLARLSLEPPLQPGL